MGINVDYLKIKSFHIFRMYFIGKPTMKGILFNRVYAVDFMLIALFVVSHL